MSALAVMQRWCSEGVLCFLLHRCTKGILLDPVALGKGELLSKNLYRNSLRFESKIVVSPVRVLSIAALVNLFLIPVKAWGFCLRTRAAGVCLAYRFMRL